MSRAVSEFFVDNEFASAVEILKAAKTFIRASKVGNSQQCRTMVRTLEDLIQTFDKIREKKLFSLKYSDIKQESDKCWNSDKRQKSYNRQKTDSRQYSENRHHTLVKYKRDKYIKHKKY